MSYKTIFNGREVQEPGVYSEIKSGIKNSPLNLSYGNVLIIDTGSNAGFGGGAGISGELASMKGSIYEFDNIDDYRSFLNGGLQWSLAKYLFRPNGLQSPGVSKIFYVSAKTSTCASLTFTFDGGDDDGGTVTLKFRNEGLVSNGVLTNSILSKGIGAKMTAGIKDTTKFKIDFYKGSFRGLDADSDPYEALAADSAPQLIARSVEFSNISELIDWLKKDSTFNSFGKLSSSTVSGTGAVTTDDLTSNSSMILAAGGTETYNSSDVDKALDAVKELYFTHILADQWGTNGKSSTNTKILAHILQEAKYDKFMVVGGGKDKDAFTGSNGSLDIAAYYNSPRVLVVHAGLMEAINTGDGFKKRDSIFKAAAVLGRTAGLPPQVPSTFKAINMDGDLHDMTEKERKKALDGGVLHTKFDSDFGAWIINEDINSIQDNDNFVNDNGISYNHAYNRIASQINAEITVNAKKQLFGNENGTNRNTLSSEDVAEWTKGYLRGKVATRQIDNLIIRFENVTVKKVQDSYHITYGFAPNTEISKLFFTGFVVEI